MAIEIVGIVGGGAWGTALAQSIRRADRKAILWAFEPQTADDINQIHENRTFLPGIQLDPGLRATSDLADLGDCDAILMVAPAQFVRSVTLNLKPHLVRNQPIVICAKGIEQKTLKLMSEVLEEILPGLPLTVLSGPSFAAEVARGLPTAVTLASEEEILGRELQLALGHAGFRPYWSDDIIGAQIGGAVKNVLAIAAGIVEGKALGASAHAALVTRGFAELLRFSRAYGAKTETVSGLSGLGDLILTCSSRQSRNMSLGFALGEGQKLEEILGERMSVTEGVYTASAVHAIADEKGIDMPICRAVHEVLSNAITVNEAIESLLSRPFKSEI